MKKKLFVLLPLLMVSLSACNLSDLMNQLSGDNESADNDSDNSNGNANNQNSVDDSIFDKPESLKKLMAFGKNTGFEITTVASENEGSGGTIVIGMKGNVSEMLEYTVSRQSDSWGFITTFYSDFWAGGAWSGWNPGLDSNTEIPVKFDSEIKEMLKTKKDSIGCRLVFP